jgi:hypothetical protein
VNLSNNSRPLFRLNGGANDLPSLGESMVLPLAGAPHHPNDAATGLEAHL